MQDEINQNYKIILNKIEQICLNTKNLNEFKKVILDLVKDFEDDELLELAKKIKCENANIAQADLIKSIVGNIKDEEIRFNAINSCIKTFSFIQLSDLTDSFSQDKYKLQLYFENPFAKEMLSQWISVFIHGFCDQSNALVIIDDYYTNNKNDLEEYFSTYIKNNPNENGFEFLKGRNINKNSKKLYNFASDDYIRQYKTYNLFEQMCRSFEDNSVLYILKNYSHIITRRQILDMLIGRHVNNINEIVEFLLVANDKELTQRFIDEKRFLIEDIPYLEKLNISMPFIDLQGSSKYPNLLEKYQENGQTIGIDKNISIGIEIETKGKNAPFLINEKILNTWKVVYDSSIPDGCEIVSSILTDCNKDMKDLESICTCLKMAKFYADKQCGGHIHIGASYIQNDYKALEKFITIWNECEEIIYKMSNAQGESLRTSVRKWAIPSHADIEDVFPNGEITINSQEDFEKLCNHCKEIEPKYRGLNIGHIGEKGKNTIEFRIPNSTIDPKTIKDNIRLYATLIEVSKKMSIDPKYKYEQYEKIKDRNVTEKQKMQNLLDLLFDDHKIKEIYKKRWEYVKDDEIFFELTRKGSPTFKNDKKYNSILDLDDFDEYIQNSSFIDQSSIYQSCHNQENNEFEI